MLNYNELKPGKYFILDDHPYLVMEFHFLRMQQRKPVAQTKIKNLITGKTIEKTFQQTDKFEEADIKTRPIKFLYSNRGEFWFCPEKNPSARFKLEELLIESNGDLMKQDSIVDALVFSHKGKEKIIGVKLPVKIELKVVEAPPSTKGNTAQGGNKQVKLETGAMINAPLFINEGDIISINTQSREYVERTEKRQ
jgi:elongation factor P